MQITFKLYATLTDYLPAEAEKHAIKLDVPDTATAYQIIDQFKVPREMTQLVLLNGVYLHPEQRNSNIIREGDTLAVWPPVAGG
ncbi:MAG: molybdopterin synthase sulfur carrier subunit [Gammaproteobacteria bacterium RIFCSPLOWO2_12_47_11]|jgi:molybdopterin converting factor small subunit|nr:MAG: molybdopterin synthase sulfur carrier subunit [Gammaproteobacteria bacterium RIFCSPLOWO2_12_47_11]